MTKKSSSWGSNIIDFLGRSDGDAWKADDSAKRGKSSAEIRSEDESQAAYASSFESDSASSRNKFSRSTVVITAWAVFVLLAAAFQNRLELLTVQFWTSTDGVALLTQIVLPALVVFYLRPLGSQMRKLQSQSEQVRYSVDRIADPEPDVSGKIVSIRHAVRQELAKLNEQLDQSLSRTGEIEAAVKREVGALESSFADNERRMLGLVQELARQRETLVTATEQVQGVVKGSREALQSELANMATQVLEAGNYARGVVEEVNLELRTELSSQGAKFTNTVRDVIDERVRPLGTMLSNQVQSINDLLRDGSGGLLETFDTQGQQLISNLDAARGRLRDELESQSRGVEQVVNRLSSSIGISLDSSVNRIESQISTASIELVGALDAGARQASQRLVDVTDEAMNSFDGRMVAMHQSANTQVGRLDELINDAAARLFPALNDHKTALERALELEGALGQSTDRLNEMLTTKAGALAESISRIVRDFHVSVGDQTKDVSDSLVLKMDRAVDALDEGSRRFTSTLQNVQDTVAVASDRLSITVAEHNATVAQHVDQIENILSGGADRLDEQLVQGVGALSAALEKGSSSIGQSFADSTLRVSDLLAGSLSEADSAFQTRLGQFQLAATQNQERLNASFDTSLRSVAELIEGGEESLVSAAKEARLRMEATTERFGGALSDMWQKFSSELGRFAERAREHISQSGSQNVADLEARVMAIAATMQDKVNSIYGGLDARTREFEANISQFGSNIDTQTSRLHRVINQKTEVFEQGMEQGIGRLDANIAGHLQRAVESLEKFLKSEEATFDRQYAELSRTLSDQTESLALQFGSSQSALDLRAAKLAASVAQFDATIEQQVSRLDKQLLERSVRLEDNLKSGIDTIGSALSGHIDRSDSLRISFLKEGQNSFERQLEVLTRTLDSRTEILDSIMRTRGADFTDQLHVSSREFEEELTKTSRALETLFRSGSTELGEVLVRQADNMQTMLKGVVEQSSAKVDQRITDIDARLSATSGRLGQVLESGAHELLTSLAEQTNLLEETLSTGAKKVTASLSKETTRLTERISESGSSLEAQLREQVGAAATVLSDGGEKIAKAVKSATIEIDAGVAEGVTSVRTSMDKSIAAASVALQSGIDQTQRQIDTGIEELLTRLSQHEKKAIGRMESAAANVGDTTRKAAELAADRLVTVNGALVQVLSALGTTRPTGRKSKSEVLDAAE